LAAGIYAVSLNVVAADPQAGKIMQATLTSSPVPVAGFAPLDAAFSGFPVQVSAACTSQDAAGDPVHVDVHHDVGSPIDLYLGLVVQRLA
jgi:hypothetical protein